MSHIAVLWKAWASRVVLVVNNPPANAGDLRDADLILGLGRSHGRGHGSPLQVFLPGESHGQRSLSMGTACRFAESQT